MDINIAIANATELKMELLTEDDTPHVEDTEYADDEWSWDVTDTDITVKMLRRRKDIREALVMGLREAFPERFGGSSSSSGEGEEDEEEPDIPDETIVEMMNMDPDVKATLLEILLELTDCVEEEGETSYYPSIRDYSCVEDILLIDKATGFMESREALPYKYEHLLSETISLIYSNPQILPLLSKMKKEQITDGMVRSALNAIKK